MVLCKVVHMSDVSDPLRSRHCRNLIKPSATTKRHPLNQAGCPVVALDEQSGDRSSPWVGNPNRGEKGGMMFGGVSVNSTDLAKPEYRDTGGASRFFKQIGGEK